jgi:ABC-type glycerol-3-phosphate transport system permease component
VVAKQPYCGNRLYISGIGVVFPAAFAFARLRFPGNNVLFGLLLITIMIPPQITLIPNYLLMEGFEVARYVLCINLSRSS